MSLPQERWLQTLWGRTDWCSWQFQTIQGESLRVLSPGIWNPDQGPDFIGAQIFLEQVQWVGAVELHVNSSDWFSHRHTVDPNYQFVVLHVVWRVDRTHPDLPTLELSRYVTSNLLRQTMRHSTDIGQLLCQRVIRPVSFDVWNALCMELLNRRIVNKRGRFGSMQPNQMRRVIARQLGAWVNRDVFESIDASIPDFLFEEVRGNLDLITALYLGQGGLLQAAETGTYAYNLYKIYQQIRHAFELNPPYRHLLWMRIRPAANPMIRLAQLAALFHAGWMNASRWMLPDPDDVRRQLQSVYLRKASVEWRSDRGINSIQLTNVSEGMANGLLVNIWAYLSSPDPSIISECLRKLPYEDNRVTRLFSDLELSDPTAMESQALLELHATGCVAKRCSFCGLARHWLQDQPPQSI